MPYIAPGQRAAIDPLVESLGDQLADEGTLNYAITRLATRWLVNRGLSYASINSVAGVLQKVGAEFDDRVTRPYEDAKIGQNGDVPEYAEIAARIAALPKASGG